MPPYLQAAVASETCDEATSAAPAEPTSGGTNEEIPLQCSRSSESDPLSATSATTVANSLEACFKDDAHTLSGRYILDEVLAVGGNSIVYKARVAHNAASHSCAAIAIKTLRPELRDDTAAIEQLKHEFRYAAALNHQNIVRVFGIEKVSGHWFMMMEFLDGQSLETLLYDTRPQRLSVAQVFSILDVCGSALTFAHGQGIVHCNFRPSNVWITAANIVRVTDFGAAQSIALPPRLESPPSASTGEDARSIFSTSAYTSPQVLAGDAPEPSDDVFSFACVAYELLTGDPPFGRLNAAEMIASHRHLAVPQGLPLRGWFALKRGLRWQPNDRTASVQALLAELSTALVHGAGPTRIGMLDGIRNTLLALVSWLNAHLLARLHAHAQISTVTRQTPKGLRTHSLFLAHAKQVIGRTRKQLHDVRNVFDRTTRAATGQPRSSNPIKRIRQLTLRSIGKQASNGSLFIIAKWHALRHHCSLLACRFDEIMRRSRRLSAGAIALVLIAFVFLNDGLDSSTNRSILSASTVKQDDRSKSMPQTPNTILTLTAPKEVTSSTAKDSSSVLPPHDQPAWHAQRLLIIDFMPWQRLTRGNDPIAYQTRRLNAGPPWRIGFDSSSTARAPLKPRSTVTLENASIHVSDRAVAAVLLLTRAGSTRDPVIVRWRTVVGSAKPGADYQEVTAGTARFAENQSVRALYVPLALNPNAQGSRSFVVELGGLSSGTALGRIKRAEVTIQKYE